jgi:hypothetical protein
MSGEENPGVRCRVRTSRRWEPACPAGRQLAPIACDEGRGTASCCFVVAALSTSSRFGTSTASGGWDGLPFPFPESMKEYEFRVAVVEALRRVFALVRCT